MFRNFPSIILFVDFVVLARLLLLRFNALFMHPHRTTFIVVVVDVDVVIVPPSIVFISLRSRFQERLDDVHFLLPVFFVTFVFFLLCVLVVTTRCSFTAFSLLDDAEIR